ncbi:MAG TPA: cytochrome c biogenesis protein ResB, partial [Dermatophilaceae bacterium]
DPDDDGLNLYADRFRWGPFGTVVAHLSFVVILVGFFLSATTGFKNTQLIVPVGSTVQVGNGTGLSVKAMSFNDAYYPDGSPSDYASDLILYKNGAQVDRKTVRVNHPMKRDGVSFYQSFFGEAAAIKVTDSAGKTLYDDAAALQWQSDDGQQSIGKFDIKSKGLTVYVIDVASGKTDPNIKAGQLQLEVDQAGKKAPIGTQVVDQGKPTTIAGLSYTFERTRQFTGLIVAHDPGAPFVWIGSTLLVLGLFLVFFFPHRRVWVRVRKTSGGSKVLCASTAKRDVAFKPQFQRLVADIQLAGTPSNSTEK